MLISDSKSSNHCHFCIKRALTTTKPLTVALEMKDSDSQRIFLLFRVVSKWLTSIFSINFSIQLCLSRLNPNNLLRLSYMEFSWLMVYLKLKLFCIQIIKWRWARLSWSFFNSSDLSPMSTPSLLVLSKRNIKLTWMLPWAWCWVSGHRTKSQTNKKYKSSWIKS